jgi:hypothetical protein
VGARRPAINGGGGRLGAASVTGRGRAEAAEWGGALMEEADGRGDGEAAPGTGRPAAARGKKGARAGG